MAYPTRVQTFAEEGKFCVHNSQVPVRIHITPQLLVPTRMSRGEDVSHQHIWPAGEAY